MRLNPLLGATTQASVAGRFRSLRKYSKTVGFCGRDSGEIVKGFIAARRNTRVRDIVAQNAAIHELREERCLRDQFIQQMRNVFLAFRHKSFLVARASAERHDDDLFAGRAAERGIGRQPEQRSACARTGHCAKEITPALGDCRCNLARTAAG